MQKILLIGAGNMGSAIGHALLESKFITPENFSVANTSLEKLEIFQKKGCFISQNPEDCIPEADIIILATKPQGVRSILENWREQKLFSGHQTILSIAAGIPVSDIQTCSGVQKVVRVMPNTPLLVQKGVSGYYCSPEISEGENGNISKMMEVFGLAIPCETEEKINAITALSGSGPAYFFRILESMSEQAENFGFSKAQAEQISLHTLLGAGLLAEESLHNNTGNFSALRERVTSKGGTTAAALASFKENNLSEIFQEGMVQAKKRTEEL